jgi:hypothetical protein
VRGVVGRKYKIFVTRLCSAINIFPMADPVMHEEHAVKAHAHALDGGTTSPLKRSRSTSPVADAKTAIVAVVSLAESDAAQKKKLLQETMGDLYDLRENVIFTAGAHWQEAKTQLALAHELERSGDAAAAATRKLAEESRDAASTWQELYEDATSLRNKLLLMKVGPDAFEDQVEALKKRKLACAATLPPTVTVSYKIASAELNEYWYKAEKDKVHAMGYDESVLPDK